MKQFLYISPMKRIIISNRVGLSRIGFAYIYEQHGAREIFKIIRSLRVTPISFRYLKTDTHVIGVKPVPQLHVWALDKLRLYARESTNTFERVNLSRFEPVTETNNPTNYVPTHVPTTRKKKTENPGLFRIYLKTINGPLVIDYLASGERAATKKSKQLKTTHDATHANVKRLTGTVTPKGGKPLNTYTVKMYLGQRAIHKIEVRDKSLALAFKRAKDMYKGSPYRIGTPVKIK